MQIKMFHIWIMASLLILVLLGCNLQVQKTGRGGDPGASPSPSKKIECWCGESWGDRVNELDLELQGIIYWWAALRCPRIPLPPPGKPVYTVEWNIYNEDSCRVYNGRCVGSCVFRISATATCTHPGILGKIISKKFDEKEIITDCVKKKDGGGDCKGVLC